MLPFLGNKNKSVAGVIIQQRKPDEKLQENQEDTHELAIQECAQALIDAVHAKDVKGVATAMKDAFEILEMLPHNEIEKEEA